MTAASPDLCPNCGAERPTNAPRGLCPRCLLQRGLASDAAGLARADGSHATHDHLGAMSVLEKLAATFGPVPRVLLRDSDRASESPVLRPSSAEMPPATERSARLHLLGEIARGGMGAVLKGRDVDLGRDLAVKVLLERHRDNPELVRRFIEEAQIAGQLQHPGIVPIHELGVLADRRPYFTMKLVKGRTLAELLCNRGETDAPRLLAILESVCQTVAYAHARGVIHRDLKPSNVMVGSFGEVQVMDWGLAKVLSRGGAVDDATAGKVADDRVIIPARTGQDGSDPDLSRAGSVMGTPAYMAPEQARGDVGLVDERADVFALGSILCEILTGQPAFAGRTSGEIQRRAARGDLAEAFQRLESCAGDGELVELACVCLAREPGDRPRDAAGMTARLTAYQRGVQERLRTAELARATEAARANEARHTAQAERRARRLTAGLAAAMVGLLVVGGGGYAWTLRQRAERRVRTAEAVEAALAEAAQHRDRARAAPRESGFWAEAVAAARRAETALAQGAADERLRRRVAAVMAALVRERDAAGAERRLLADLEVLRGSRELNSDGIRTSVLYHSVFRTAGLDVDATDTETAGAWIRRRSEPVELASYLDDWASIRRAVGPPAGEWTHLLAAARAADPDPWRDAIRARVLGPDQEAAAALSALADDVRALDAQPAASLVLLAQQLRNVIGDRTRAEAVLRRAQRKYPGDFWVNVHLALVQGRNGGTLLDQFPRPHEAARYLTAAAALRPDSYMAEVYLHNSLFTAGDMTGAIAGYQETVRIRPADFLAHRQLGNALGVAGDLHGALAEYRDAVLLAPGSSHAHFQLAAFLLVLDDPDAAIAECREAIRLAPGAYLGYLGHALHAEALMKKRDKIGAIAACREVIRLEPDSPGARGHAGVVLRGAGDLPGAIAEFREAIRLEPDKPLHHLNLAETLREAGDLPGAIAELRAALRRIPGDARIHENLGFCLRMVGDLPGAIAELREAIHLDPGFAALAHKDLALALLAQGDSAAALAESVEAVGHGRLLPQVNYAHGLILMFLGRFAKALPYLEWAATRFAEMEQGAAEQETRRSLAPLRWLAGQEADLAALASDGGRDRAELTCLDLAALARGAGRPALAVRLYQVAFLAVPAFTNDRASAHRLAAARAAAVAAAGQGKDRPAPNEAERVTLRGQALDWLKAELEAWARGFDPIDARSRATAVRALEEWKIDPDLAGVRDAQALDGLSEEERTGWQAFWLQVESLVTREGKGAP